MVLNECSGFDSCDWCVVEDGKRCGYFENYVKGLARSHPEYTEAVAKYERNQEMSEEKQAVTENEVANTGPPDDAEFGEEVDATDDAPEAEEADLEQRSLTVYEERVSEVIKMKEMVNTGAWEKLYARLLLWRLGAEESLHTVEKMQDVIRYQKTVALVNDIIDHVEEPVIALELMNREDLPLFSNGPKTLAEFNADAGFILMFDEENVPDAEPQDSDDDEGSEH